MKYSVLPLTALSLLLLSACADRKQEPSTPFLADAGKTGSVSNAGEASSSQPRWKVDNRQAIWRGDTRDTGSSIHSSDMSDRGYDTITGRYNP